MRALTVEQETEFVRWVEDTAAAMGMSARETAYRLLPEVQPELEPAYRLLIDWRWPVTIATI